MLDSAKSLREAIAEQRPKNTKKGFPTALRRRVVEWSKQQLKKGRTKSYISKKMGLSPTAIASWTRECEQKETSTSSFLPILLQEEPPFQEKKTFTLKSPNGYQVKDLSLQELQSLLEVLG